MTTGRTVQQADLPRVLREHVKRIRILEARLGCCTDPSTYLDVVGRIDVEYAYYKMDETGSADWADSSGGGRTLSYGAQTGEVRGVAGMVDEGDGTLGVYTGTDTPAAANPYSGVGNRAADSFFRFAGTAPMSLIAWVNPDFTPGGSASFSWGVCGNVDNYALGAAATAGYGIYVQHFTGIPFVRRRDIAGNGPTVSATTAVVQGDPMMIALTYGGTDLGCWINGVLEGSAASSVSMDATAGNCFFAGNCGIAEGIGGTWAPWKGTLDSIIVAAGDLSALIPSLYAAGPAPGDPGNYVWTTPGVWLPPTIEVEF